MLAEARAAAWREATPSLLGEADAPRSAVAARDSAAVAEVARAGVRYTGLRYTVAEVATVSATPDRAVLRARIDSGAYAVTAATGSTSRPAATGHPGARRPGSHRRRLADVRPAARAVTAVDAVSAVGAARRSRAPPGGRGQPRGAASEANRFSPSRSARNLVTSWPRTLLPAASSGGEKVARPPLPGDTVTMPPLTPLLPGIPIS